MSEILQLQGLSVGYGDRVVVRDINGNLAQGESLLVIGHNGAGKTTFLRTLFGLQPQLEGGGTVLSESIASGCADRLMQAGGRYLGQGLRCFNELTVREHRHVLNRLYGFAVPSDIDPPVQYGFLKRVAQLSVGQRRLEVLRMLAAGSPRLFLLDEPTAGIDIGQSQGILDWIEETKYKGVSFVVIEHNFDRMLEICDKAMVIRSGKVTYFGESAALKDEVLLSRYFL